MMKRAKFIATTSFFTLVFISSLFIGNIFATQAQWEEIKKLEDAGKTVPQEVIVRPKVEYKAEGLRDPFQAPIIEQVIQGEKVQVPDTGTLPLSLAVQGIIWGGRFPQAIINNKVVKVKDTIEGALIVAIDKDSITVLFQGRQYNLAPPRVESGSYKKP